MSTKASRECGKTKVDKVGPPALGGLPSPAGRVLGRRTPGLKIE